MKSRLLSVLRAVTFCGALILSSCETDLSTKSPSQSATAASSTAKATPQDVSARNTSNEGSTTTKADDAVPRIRAPEPDYGPVSGGTEIVISGDDLNCTNGKLKATFDHSSELNCSLSTQLPLRCITPATKSSGDLTLRVACIVGSSSSSKTALWTTDPVQFTYRPDPVITAFTPNASIISGGITQTVEGEHLDSVAQPKMVLTYEQHQQISPCIRHQAGNGTVLRCRAGAVSVAGTTPNDTARVQATEIPSTAGKVTVGFIFDGVVQPKYSLRMFYDPAFDPFQPETKDFLTSEENLFTFAGVFPHFHFPEDDVRVQVGGRACVGVEISEAKVTCRAPVLPKPVIRYGPSELNTLDVTVSVGNCFSRLGHLHYTAVESFNVIMSVMIAVLAFIFVVSCFFGCVTFICRGGAGAGGGFGGRRAGAKDPPFESIPNYESSLDDDATEKRSRDAKQLGFGGKKRARRGEKGGDEEGAGDVECVAMQYRRDRSEDQI